MCCGTVLAVGWVPWGRGVPERNIPCPDIGGIEKAGDPRRTRARNIMYII
jgi:hypothetical protein